MKFQVLFCAFILMFLQGSGQSNNSSFKSINDNKFNPAYGVRKTWNPELFQGNNKRKNYFEGWYFKLVSADLSKSLAFIPGISLSKDSAHAFVQVIEGHSGKTWYFSYPIEAFSYFKKDFKIFIVDNFFSTDSISINLKNSHTQMSGALSFSDVSEYPVRLFKPGIMGWYRFVPFMECYHGIVSADHSISGAIKISNTEYDFTDGKGYIEKDWGRSMPSSWVWMQSNHFVNDNISFSFSLANIPWLGRSFPGFIGFLLYEDEYYHFSTYNRARISSAIIAQDTVNITISHPKYHLDINAIHRNTGVLKAPVTGNMDRRISEGLESTICLTLMNNQQDTIFHQEGYPSGLEIVGDTKELIDQ